MVRRSGLVLCAVVMTCGLAFAQAPAPPSWAYTVNPPPAPGAKLAGSPSYTVRQLFDLQQGVRKGPWSPLMTSAVAKLTVDDMIAIAAYTASREP